jgi:hypothetical protein
MSFRTGRKGLLIKGTAAILGAERLLAERLSPTFWPEGPVPERFAFTLGTKGSVPKRFPISFGMERFFPEGVTLSVTAEWLFLVGAGFVLERLVAVARLLGFVAHDSFSPTLKSGWPSVKSKAGIRFFPGGWMDNKRTDWDPAPTKIPSFETSNISPPDPLRSTTWAW